MFQCFNRARASRRAYTASAHLRPHWILRTLRNVFIKKEKIPRDEEQGLITPPVTPKQAPNSYGTFAAHESALFSSTRLHQALTDPNVHIDEIRESFPEFNGNPITPYSPEASTSSSVPTGQLTPQSRAASPVASSVYSDHSGSSDQVTASPRKLQPTPESFSSDYAVVKTLKRNNEGPVHLVRHRESGKQFIIKQMRYLVTADGMQLDPEEVFMMMHIRHYHRNIIQVKEIIDDWTRGISNMVLEFCQGGDVDALISHSFRVRGQPVPKEIVLQITADLLEATAFLSRQELIHRDIKSDNVFLRWNENNTNGLPTAVLADFGLAATLQQSRRDTRCGTRAFWAPEIKANPGVQGICTEKSDMYSVGVTMFHLITGQLYLPTIDDIQEAFNRSTVKDHPEFLALLEACLSAAPSARPAPNELHRTCRIFRQHIKEWTESGGKISKDFYPAPFANGAYLQPDSQPEPPSERPPRYSQIFPDAPSMTAAIADLPPLRRMAGHSDLYVAGGAEYAQEIADIPGPFRSPLPSVGTETDESAQAEVEAEEPCSWFSWGSDV